MTLPSIDVIIVAFNARELLASSLDHLRLQTVPHATFVVDNASTDGTTAMVRERFPEVTLIENPNVGFARACNEGVRAGHGEIVVLVNVDMDAAPNFLRELVAPFADEDVGMVAGLTLQPDGRDIVDGFGIEVDNTLNAYNRLRHRSPADQPGRLLGPSGGAAAYRRAAWESVGGMDEAFFVYGEDLDLALRLRLAGWQAVGAPRARGVHLGGATVGVDSPFQRRHAAFARGYILRRYGVLRRRAAVRALVTEALVVGWGVVRHRTLLPLRGRVAGWRAAGGQRLPIPRDAVEDSITLRETLRRLARAR